MGEKTKRAFEISLSLLTGAVLVVVFLYQNFQTQAAAISDKSSFEKRLDRIEEKQDKVIDLILNRDRDE